MASRFHTGRNFLNLKSFIIEYRYINHKKVKTNADNIIVLNVWNHAETLGCDVIQLFSQKVLSCNLYLY